MANDREGGIPSWAFALLGILGVAGFLFWISTAAQPAATVAVTEGDDTTAAGPAGGMTGEVVSLQQIAANTDTLQGRELVLEDIAVSAAMGQQAFWIDLPNQQPFLIRVGSGAAGGSFQQGDTVDIAGRIVPMTDSVISDWMTAGAITQNQEAEARFATSFLQATTVRFATPRR